MFISKGSTSNNGGVPFLLNNNNSPEVLHVSARRLGNCHSNTQWPPIQSRKIIQAFTKSLEHALNQSSVTNQWPIVFQSNTTQCFIVLQSWTIINLLFSWLENNRNMIVACLKNNRPLIGQQWTTNWKTIEHWLENNRAWMRYAWMI